MDNANVNLRWSRGGFEVEDDNTKALLLRISLDEKGRPVLFFDGRTVTLWAHEAK